MKKERYEETVRCYATKIYRYCLYKLNSDPHVAQDAVNEVMLILYEKWEKLTPDNIRAWLYRCADNVVKRKLSERSRHSNNTMPLEDVDDKIGYEDEYFSDEEELFKSCITLIKAELSDGEFELFKLRYLEKKGLMQICALKNVPFSTLRYRLSKIEPRVKEIIRKNF
ncbi:MAG: sigma-70 family RNA polymerase sigma factor [Clostridia bacterium]|nr:sigma-70 family RNA polymerase sigma factor [Clostridia bacterium]